LSSHVGIGLGAREIQDAGTGKTDALQSLKQWSPGAITDMKVNVA